MYMLDVRPSRRTSTGWSRFFGHCQGRNQAEQKRFANEAFKVLEDQLHCFQLYLGLKQDGIVRVC